MKVQVVGSGCPTCKKMHQITEQAIKELNLDTPVEYISDVSKLVELGVMTSPALVIDDKPVMTGFTPDIEKIKAVITKAMSNSKVQND